MAIIQYLWIGSPTNTTPTTIAGHDVMGPIAMAKQLESQASSDGINFWCLAEHKNFYEKQFRAHGVHTKIRVETIEGLLSESADDPDAQFFKERLTMAKSLDAKERVTFKDGFSLLLLAKKGGIYCDTNVLPHKTIDFSDLENKDKLLTARSPDGYNDFFFMYAKEPLHEVLLNVLHRWMSQPTLANLSAFWEEKVPKVMEFELRMMGIEKISYKSYFGEAKPMGLFYWINYPRELSTKLSFGDVNQTQTSDTLPLLKLTPSYSLYKVNDKDKVPDSLYRIIPTTTAFVITHEGKLQFFNKEKTPPLSDLGIVIDEPAYLHEINVGREFGFDSVSKRSTPVHEISITAERMLYLLIKEKLEQLKVCPHIRSLGPYTLLHYAVFTNDEALVKALLDSGAKENIRAQFVEKEALKDMKEMSMTAQELAIHLGHLKLLPLFQNSLGRPDPLDLHDFLQNNIPYQSLMVRIDTIRSRISKFGQDDNKVQKKLEALEFIQTAISDPTLSPEMLLHLLQENKTRICDSTASKWRFFIRGEVDSKRLFENLIDSLQQFVKPKASQ